MFYECARWPDDTRRSPYDHPTWHYAFHPVILRSDRPPHPPKEAIDGDAFEAFGLNMRELGNAKAPEADRALALCWVMHIVGDIHQPLHAAQLFSPVFPDGDHGGSLETVLDPETNAPEPLHWFWDDSVNRSDGPSDVTARAQALEAEFPRAALSELGRGTQAQDLPAWASESYRLAVSNAYALTLENGPKAAPKALPSNYVKDASRIAARRAALAGYRLADLLRSAFAQ